MTRGCRKSCDAIPVKGIGLAGGGGSGCGLGLRRDEGDALDDVEAGAAEQPVDDGFGEAGGVVLDAHGAGGFVEGEGADSVDFADAAEGHHGGFGGRRAVAVHHVQLRHASMVSRAWARRAVVDCEESFLR